MDFGFFKLLGIVALLTVTSNNRARYGIMASPPSFRISPEKLPSPTDLFLLIAANLLLLIFVMMAKGTPELTPPICGTLRSQLNTEE
jgi:hypothetical protein